MTDLGHLDGGSGMRRDWLGQREGDPLIQHNLEPQKEGAESLILEEYSPVWNPNSYIHTGLYVNKNVLKCVKHWYWGVC